MDEFESYLFENDNNLTAEDVRRTAREETLNTLRAMTQHNALVLQAKEAAIAQATREHPDFAELYSNQDVCKKFIEKRPTLARMILTAESTGSDALGELYGHFVDAAHALGLAESTTANDSRPSKPNAQSKDDSPLATSQSRKALIRSFEERFGDVPVDLADDSDEGRKTRRY